MYCRQLLPVAAWDLSAPRRLPRRASLDTNRPGRKTSQILPGLQPGRIPCGGRNGCIVLSCFQVPAAHQARPGCTPSVLWADKSGLCAHTSPKLIPVHRCPAASGASHSLGQGVPRAGPTLDFLVGLVAPEEVGQAQGTFLRTGAPLQRVGVDPAESPSATIRVQGNILRGRLPLFRRAVDHLLGDAEKAKDRGGHRAPA